MGEEGRMRKERGREELRQGLQRKDEKEREEEKKRKRWRRANAEERKDEQKIGVKEESGKTREMREGREN